MLSIMAGHVHKQQQGYASMPTMNDHGVHMPLPERMDT